MCWAGRRLTCGRCGRRAHGTACRRLRASTARLLMGQVVANGSHHWLRAAAIGIVVVLSAAAISASGGMVSVRITAGRHICRAAPTVDGFYTAGHCAQYPGGITSVTGQERVPPYSVDPSRDLAHIVGPAYDVTLRAPVPGEAAAIQMSGTVGSYYRFERVVDGRVYTRERTPGDYQLWCWVEGHLPRSGMSGSGLYADSDGALAGVMTNGGPIPRGICASGEAALALGVP